MSYDIVAFDPAATADSGFADWCKRQTEWGEGHDYDDAEVTTPGLRAFYAELIETFPPMNGPDASGDESVEGMLADYSIGSGIVYVAFGWSRAGQAKGLFRDLAARHNVAVAWVSDPSGTMPITRPWSADATHSITNLAGSSFLGPGETVRCFQTMFEHFDTSTRGVRRLGQDGFIQAAGSSGRLSVEIRAEVGGVADLYVLGHGASPEGQPDVVIPFGQHTTTVHESEVFVAAEAAEIFHRYYERDEVPAGYSLRALGFA